jgi:hypothetical protein
LNYTCATAVGSGYSCPKNTSLNDFRADVSYYWRDKIGLTAQVFNISGSSNPFVNQFSNGNRNPNPDSTGMLLQLDATPWGAGGSPFGPRFNMRVGVQYALFTQFNGAGSNYDGAGSKASDNNAFRVFTWIAY